MEIMKEVELKVPNLGEAEDTEIIEIPVKKGDEIKKNDPIIVLESEKAAMEVPSDFNGVIKDIKVKEGESVKEGMIFAIMQIEEIENISTKTEKSTVVTKAEKDPINVEETDKNISSKFVGINAGPAVRKIARELEINLNMIIGSGKNKMITKDDLKNFIHSGKNYSLQSYPDIQALSEFGDYKVENQSNISKFGAKNLIQSWSSIPHVNHFEEADITKIEEQRRDLNSMTSSKITPLAYIVKATSIALKEHPIMNSSLIDEGKLMIKKYINIGIAVNTEQGLVVPVIKNSDHLNIREIASEIFSLSKKAKDKKLLKNDVEGATFTISSLGLLGGVGFTPIINPPEVAILGISRTKTLLVKDKEKIIEKLILPFSLSYDHRVINGVDAGKFSNYLKSVLEKGL